MNQPMKTFSTSTSNSHNAVATSPRSSIPQLCLLPGTFPALRRRLAHLLLMGLAWLAATPSAWATDPKPANLILRLQMSDSGSPLTDSATSPLSFTAFGSGQQYSQSSVPSGTYGAITVPGSGFGTAVTQTTSSGSGWKTASGANKLNSLANNFTVMAWVKPAALSGTQRVLSDNYGAGSSWSFGLNGNYVYFTKFNIADISSSSTLSAAGQWVHIAVTVSSSGGCTFYINGQSAGNTGNIGNGNTSSAAFIVGAEDASGGGQFKGSIDDIRVYNTVLTSSEVAQAGADGSGGAVSAISKQFAGHTWALVAGYRAWSAATLAQVDSGMRSLFTTSQGAGNSTLADVFSKTTDGTHYSNSNLWSIATQGFLMEGYEPDGTSRNIQGTIYLGTSTSWASLGAQTISPNIANAFSPSSAVLYNASGTVTPTYKYVLASSGSSSPLDFSNDSGDFIMLGVTDGSQGSGDGFDTTFNNANNSIGIGLSDGTGTGYAMSSFGCRGNPMAITTISGGNRFSGSGGQSGLNNTGWVMVWVLADGMSFSTPCSVTTTATYNNPRTSGINSFGTVSSGSTPTYGTLFVAPNTNATLKLTDFTFYWQGSGTITYQAAVYAWNGSYATGSPVFAQNYSMTGNGSYQAVTTTIPGGAALTPGATYIAFFTTADAYSISQNGSVGSWSFGSASSLLPNGAGGEFRYHGTSTYSPLTNSAWTTYSGYSACIFNFSITTSSGSGGSGTSFTLPGQLDLAPPPGSVAFGYFVTNFPNGNFMVTDPLRTVNGNTNCGAVYLYHGATLTNICVLTGSQNNDRVGYGGVQMLTNNCFLVFSPYWANGSATNAGAVTWFNSTNGPAGMTGVSNAVSAANSLVGGYAGDGIRDGYYATSCTVLSNGNYVILTPGWNGNRGAATWGSKSAGVVGTISSTISLVGNSVNDLSSPSVVQLNNGNYVVACYSYSYSLGNGAVSWCSGTASTPGVVGSGRSFIGGASVTLLANGNYVVGNSSYDFGGATDSGFAAWCSGTSASPVGYPGYYNCLYGSSQYQQVGSDVTALANGNFVVRSARPASWDNQYYYGAVTWASGTGNTYGQVHTGNSLYGNYRYDNVGGGGIYALPNGNYVVCSPDCDWAGYQYPDNYYSRGGVVNCLSGTQSSAGTPTGYNHIRGSYNYLYAGQQGYRYIGEAAGSGGITVMPDSSFIILSPQVYNSSYGSVGAITWANGNMSLPNNTINSGNSLVGGSFVALWSVSVRPLPSGYVAFGTYQLNNYTGAQWMYCCAGMSGTFTIGTGASWGIAGNNQNDYVGNGAMTILPNGNFVFQSPYASSSAGAITWHHGSSYSTPNGYLSTGNSLMGYSSGDLNNASVGVLSNGNYTVQNTGWNAGRGFVLLGVSNAPITGYFSSSVALVGSSTNDYLRVIATLSNGDYIVGSPNWDNGASADVGSLTYCSGSAVRSGTLSSVNALVGASAGDQIGNGGVLPMPGGGFVLGSTLAKVAGVTNAGSVIWVANSGAFTGTLAATNGLTGSSTGDQVGSGGLLPLTNGLCVVRSPYWNNGILKQAGAISLIKPNAGNPGPVSVTNSVLGLVRGDANGAGSAMVAAYDYANSQLIVAHGRGNRVTLLGRTNLDITFTQQPVAQSIFAGSNATFTVAVTGTGPFTYQWRKGTNEIAGATGTSYTLTNAMPTDSDYYYCVVSVGVGSMSSQPAQLNVMSPVSLGTGLTGFWPCNDGSDVSGFNHPLVPYSYTYPGTGGDYYRNWTFVDYAYYNKVGKWLSRDSYYSYSESYGSWASITNYPKSTNAMTIAFWLYTWGYLPLPAVIACDGNTVTNSNLRIMAWYNSPSNRYEMSFTYANRSNTFAVAFPSYTWRHLTLTLDGSMARIYTNGVYVTNFTYSRSVAMTNGGKTLFFSGTGTNVTKAGVNYYNGGFDEIMTWDRALSATEVQMVYGQGAVGQPALSLGAPMIVAQPQDSSANPGQTVTFTVSAVGLPQFFQWRKDGTNIPGATAGSLTLSNLVVPDRGYYSVVITNAYGSVTSSNAYLLVGGPPVITAQPASFISLAGETRRLNPTITGDPVMFYTWIKDDVVLPDVTGSNVIFPSIQLSNAGNYSVILSNYVGMATSSVATVSVVMPITNFTILAGSSRDLTLVSSTNVPLAYAWYYNNIFIPGATNATLSLTNLKVSQSGQYKAVITAPFGSTTNLTTITVMVVPSIATQPVSVFTNIGATVSLKATAISAGAMTVQWYFRNAPLAGATNSTLTLSKTEVGQMGHYRLRASNAVGYTDSARAWVILGPGENNAVGWGDSSSGQTLFTPEWTNLVSLSAGDSHTLGLRGDGNVFAAGGSDYGQTTIPAGLARVVAVAAGGNHSLALRENGTVVAWGNNDLGQADVPAGLSNVVAIAAGASHSVAIKGDGTAIVWGGDVPEISAVPGEAAGAVGISAAAQYTVALRQDGEVAIWGAALNDLNVTPPEATDLIIASAGLQHIVAIQSGGNLVAWGDSTFNQTVLPEISAPAVWVSAGACHSLALLTNGTVLAWGAGTNSDIAEWPDYAQSSPLSAPAFATAIAAGKYFSVAAGAAAPHFIEPLPSRVGYTLGQTITLVAKVGGCLPLRYQWFKDGALIAGAVTPTLTLTNLGPYAGAGYVLTVSNLAGTLTSENISVERDTPYEPLQITQHPASIYTIRSGSAVLSVGVQGTGPIRYQWLKAGSGMAGQTNDYFQAPTAQLSDSATYSVVVSNDWETATSETAFVSVLDPPAWPETYTNVTRSAGDGLTLTVDNTGSGPFDYEWYLNGQPIDGVNTNTLVITNLTWQNEGEYSVKITNPVGSITRSFYNLHVVSPPYLLTDVADVASPRGSNAQFTVRAGGEPPLGCLWYEGDSVLPDEFHTNLVIANVAYSHTNLTWHVVVSNFMGMITSRVARVTIIEPPVIITQPVSVLAEANTEARFSVTCGGTLPLVYQWYLNGGAVAGGTSDTLVIPSVTAGKQGVYEVEISNPAGKVTSDAVTLAANVSPVAIGVSTTSTNVAPGSTFGLTAKVAGSGPFSFQWFLNGVALEGQTNLTLIITNTAPEAAGWYTYTVSNAFGGSTLDISAGTEVRVVNLPYIESGPDDVLAILGRSASFEVVVRGTNRYSYQWMKEGEPINGATSSSYTIENPTAADVGQYSVAVANSEGTTWSSQASLTFAKLPSITSQPQNTAAGPGESATFSVAVTSQFPVSYQWRQDGGEMFGETNSTLEITLPLRVVGWEHTYSVMVSSEVGRVSSMGAVLNVKRTPEVMLKHSRLVTQSLILRPGWNSIYLTVQPLSNRVEQVFADAPWTSVWMWRDRENPVQFIQSMTEAAWKEPDWLVNFQTNRTESFQNNLYRVFANQAYLIHLDATNDTYIEITGEPAPDSKSWRADSYNLTGLPIERGREPTAADYFRYSPAHYDSVAGQIKPIYRLSASGAWELLSNTDPLEASVAYWFYVRGGSTYTGPMEVSLSYGRGLLFTRDVDTLRMTLFNHTDAARRVWMSAHPAYAGGFPLMVREVTDQGVGFVEMPAAQAVDVPANGRAEFVVGADRLRTSAEGFESVMIIGDDRGLGLQLPVLVEHLGAVTESSGKVLPNVTGLWVGQATFDGISEVNSVTVITNRLRFTNDIGQVTNVVMLSYTNTPSPTPTPVASGLSQRIIFHVDTNNTTRLLSEVFQLYRESTSTNDVDGYQVTAKQGESVLVTDRSRLADFKGSRLRDGTLVGRRISSPTFAFEGSAATNHYVACTGQFGPGQTVTVTFGLSADNPLNPFKHKYHPDHDNLGTDFRTYSEEAYGVIREVTLVFDSESGGTSPAAGYDELKGTYREKVRGLHKNPIYGSGRFVLRRFNTIGELNPAN